jgi:carbon monoxide dehydrogenase subunit G
MAAVTVSIEIDAPPAEVWAELADLPSHVEWMADAESMRITSERTSGVGTVAEVATIIGPLRTTDVMRFTEWDEGRSMAVRHEGLVSGTGRFTLDDIGADRTRMTWSEDLDFPIHFGGAIGAAVARPIFRRIWAANLSRLKARIEG